MFSFFNEPDADAAKLVFEEIGDWIWQADFKPLKNGYLNLEKGWKRECPNNR
jgi:hypothetical protein